MNTSRRNKQNVRYAFHDINAKVTHVFSEKSRADISLYSGNDLFKFRHKEYLFDPEPTNIDKFNLQWGNFTASAIGNTFSRTTCSSILQEFILIIVPGSII